MVNKLIANKTNTERPWWRFWHTKKERAVLRYKKGFKFALEELTRGEKPETLLSYIECAKHFNDADLFEDGMEDAIDKFTNGVTITIK